MQVKKNKQLSYIWFENKHFRCETTRRYCKNCLENSLSKIILQECDNFKRIHFNLILQFTEFVPNVLNMRANTTYFGTRHFFHSRF